MNAYTPNDPGTMGLLAALMLCVLLAAFGISFMKPGTVARLAAWLLAAAAAGTAERLTTSEPPGLRMVAIILVALWGMKAVVCVEEQIAGKQRLRPLAWWAFALGWLGMRPAEFRSFPGPPRDDWRELTRRGAARLVPGVAILVAAVMLYRRPASNSTDGLNFIAATALLLVGLSLVIHFGLLNLLAGWWRRWGANCRPIFRAPAHSTSLAEFWAKRWNLAFSEMSTLAVVRPLRPFLGTRTATVVAFLFSGLLHELAISVPVKAGFGLPLAYFALHAVAVQCEQFLQRAGFAIDRVPWLGRLWTAAWLIVPLPLLFHEAFLRDCIWPLVI